MLYILSWPSNLIKELLGQLKLFYFLVVGSVKDYSSCLDYQSWRLENYVSFGNIPINPFSAKNVLALKVKINLL